MSPELGLTSEQRNQLSGEHAFQLRALTTTEAFAGNIRAADHMAAAVHYRWNPSVFVAIS